MTLLTSRIPAVMAYLFTQCTASSQLGAATTNPVRVIYGYANLSEDYPQRALWIGGGDPDAADGGTAATSDQAWVGAGARNRDENLSIPCYCESWTGDGNLQAATEDVFAIGAAVEALTMADPGAGNVLNGFTKPGITNYQLRYVTGPNGLAAQLLFDFTAYARIGVL